MMSVEDADTADNNPTDDQFERVLISLLRGFGEDVEPWKVRPPENTNGPAKLLVGAREGVVRGRLEGAGYEVTDLGFPVENDGWIAAWEVSQ
jgi:hypothetical protein